MIGKTDMIQPQFYGTFYLIGDLCLTVRRKFGVNVTVCGYSASVRTGFSDHTMVPPPNTCSP